MKMYTSANFDDKILDTISSTSEHSKDPLGFSLDLPSSSVALWTGGRPELEGSDKKTNMNEKAHERQTP